RFATRNEAGWITRRGRCCSSDETGRFAERDRFPRQTRPDLSAKSVQRLDDFGSYLSTVRTQTTTLAVLEARKERATREDALARLRNLANGRDEMNLCELPFATLSERHDGREMLRFEIEDFDR